MKNLMSKIISCVLAAVTAFSVSVSFKKFATVTASAATGEVLKVMIKAPNSRYSALFKKLFSFLRFDFLVMTITRKSSETVVIVAVNNQETLNDLFYCFSSTVSWIKILQDFCRYVVVFAQAFGKAVNSVAAPIVKAFVKGN